MLPWPAELLARPLALWGSVPSAARCWLGQRDQTLRSSLLGACSP